MGDMDLCEGNACRNPKWVAGKLDAAAQLQRRVEPLAQKAGAPKKADYSLRPGEQRDFTLVSYTHLDVYKRQPVQSEQIIQILDYLLLGIVIHVLRITKGTQAEAPDQAKSCLLYTSPWTLLGT